MTDSEAAKQFQSRIEVLDLKGRDFLYKLRLDFEPQLQLMAIKKQLEKNQALEQEMAEYIENKKAFLKSRQQSDVSDDHELGMVEDFINDLFYENAYHDATHSMAAVGLLAPFLESLFSQCFMKLENQYTSGTISGLANETRFTNSVNAFWDCHFFFSNNGNRNKNIVDGTVQLAEATGLVQFLSSDFRTVLKALFTYRNFMFHNGMEWPVEERSRFQNRIRNENWPADWFEEATSGGDPWIFYMTEEFIKRCLQLAENVLDAFAALVESLEEQDL